MNRREKHAVAASHVFDGTLVHRDAAVIIENETITALVPHAELPRNIPVENHAGLWLAPGFIDLQVKGGGDVLLNNDPSQKAIETIATAHRKFGTTSLLPTLITDTTDIMQAALDAVRAARSTQPGVLGIHLEGPYLSPQRPGVHSIRHIRPPLT